ncbi:hypothetical protein RB653_001713 [Dictyostelium firmibasis]|uniref:Pseudouridine synthase RsuA/RluA-like domain-containing protein n=1 Tax=Dictyostelium firmibasis TaxID=79012 RepID=A0AAN7YWV2_9MYCE
MILEIGRKLRVERILSNLGVCERGRVPQFLREKRVTVLGKKVTPSTKVNAKDIKIDGKPIENSGPLHIAVHKPSGYICSTVNDGDHKVIYDILPKEFFKRKPILSIAGRLDKWVTGLVVMSQDGKLVDRIITPKDDGCGKDYEVVLKDKLVGDEAEAFENGTMMLRGETIPCKPAKLQVLDVEKNKVKVTLYEGRYHQIRRMFASTENKAVEIHRTRIGPVELGDLELGKWRYLTETELKELYSIKIDQTIDKRDKKKAKLKAFLEKKKNRNQKDNNFGNIKDDQDDDGDDDDYEDDFVGEEDEELSDEEKRNMDDMFNEKGEIIYKTNPKQSNNTQFKTIRYEDKLKSLVQSEETESNKTNLFNTKNYKEIENDDVDEEDEEHGEEEHDEEDEEEDEEETRRRENDPYADIRKQFHDKFRAMIKSKDRDAEFDEETGYYIPKSERSSRYDISDQELERLITLDSDMKIIEQQAIEEEELEEKQNSAPPQNLTKKINRLLKEDKEDKEDHLDDTDENIVRIDSTPQKFKPNRNLDKLKKYPQNFKNRKTSKKINKK